MRTRLALIGDYFLTILSEILASILIPTPGDTIRTADAKLLAHLALPSPTILLAFLSRLIHYIIAGDALLHQRAICARTQTLTSLGLAKPTFSLRGIAFVLIFRCV